MGGEREEGGERGGREGERGGGGPSNQPTHPSTDPSVSPQHPIQPAMNIRSERTLLWTGSALTAV